MGKIADTYLQYGVSLDMALKYESIGLSVTIFRATPISQVVELYGIPNDEVSWVKRCITRQPIDKEIVQKLLENSNFVCCCCKGMKSDSYIIHHIEEYEVSQDNSYKNLAVLCLNDHDLAHRPPKITNKLTPGQIKKCKTSWEQQVHIHNIVISQDSQREKILTKLPRYNALELEINDLKNRIADKEKIITRSEAFFDAEILKYKMRIEELDSQKAFLEGQVSSLALKLDGIDLSKSSDIYLKALDYFFNGDIDAAISTLNESQLDDELEKLQQREEDLYKSYEQNANSWVLRAQLLTIECKFDVAKKSAERGLKLYEKLCNLNPEEYTIKFVSSLESVGSIFYNIGDYERAGEFFNQGFSICLQLRDMGDVSHLPILAVIMQNIGACYYSIGKSEESLKFLKEADSLLSIINPIHEGVGYFDNSYFELMHLTVLGNLGTTCKKLGENQRALDFYLRGSKICEKLLALKREVYMEGIFRYLLGLGSFYFYSGNYKSAQEEYLRVIPFAKKLLEKHNERYIVEVADLLRDICATYIFQSDLSSAKSYCDDALNLFRQIGSSYGDEVEMHMVDTLFYKAIITIEENGYSEKVVNLAQEAIEICKKYPNNIDAQEYPRTINALLKSAKDANN